MRDSKYLRFEKRIAASDTGGILERWAMGQALLADAKKITAAGNLKHGALDRIVADAKAAGFTTITEREIQYRLRCARAYASEAEIRTACSDFKSWSDLRAAGFPVVQVPLDADTGPYDPRTPEEKRRDAARELARRGEEAAGQLALFPDDKYDEYSTLTELAKYAAEMAEMTDRYARRDRDRTDYLTSLIDAVNGDMSKTWGEAQAALEAAGGGAS
jgi:hypothetical protein